MLHITGSMKTLRGELESAHGICKDIINVLDNVSSSTNYTVEIGIFIIQMPEYKVLAKDSDNAKQILRKVCSGELPPKEASDKFRKGLKEVEVLLAATKLACNLS